RRGKKVGETTPGETNPEQLAALMVGTEVPSPRERAAGQGEGRAVLTLQHLDAKGLHDVSLEVKAGEIVGIAGVDGNGQRELAEVLTGLREWTGGTFTYEDQKITEWTPRVARERGVAHIPEDRLRRAIISEL